MAVACRQCLHWITNLFPRASVADERSPSARGVPLMQVGKFSVSVSMISGSTRQIHGLHGDDSYTALCKRVEHAFDLPAGRAQLCLGTEVFTSDAYHKTLNLLNIKPGSDLVCVRRVLPETTQGIPVGVELARQGKWCGAVVTEGRAYFSPFNASGILDLDLVSKESRNIQTDHLYTGGAKWACATEANGIVYFCPCLAPCILCLDVESGHVRTHSTRNIVDLDSAKWYGAASIGETVIFGPHHAPGILKLNVVTDDLQLISTEALHSGSDKWTGAAVVDDCIYFAPFNAPCILELQVSTEGRRRIQTDIVHRGLRKWASAVAVDGSVFFAPFDAPCVLQLKLETGGVSGIAVNPNAPLLRSLIPPRWAQSPQQQFVGAGVLNGEVYFVPFDADHILQLTAGTCAINRIYTQEVCQFRGKWQGVAVSNGRLYAAPSNSSVILELL